MTRSTAPRQALLATHRRFGDGRSRHGSPALRSHLANTVSCRFAYLQVEGNGDLHPADSVGRRTGAERRCWSVRPGRLVAVLSTLQSMVPPAKWSDLNDTQRSCFLERTKVYQRSIPHTGIDQGELKTTCNIP